MACYAVPLASAIIIHLAEKLGFKLKNASLRLLKLVLGGGAIMLIIDHIWNNELLLFSGDLAMDLLLGVAMTLGAILFWALAVCFGAAKAPEKAVLEA